MQLAKCFTFDLTNAFASQPQCFADFLQRLWLTVVETESHAKNRRFTRIHFVQQTEDVLKWLRGNQDRVRELLVERGCVLLRGFRAEDERVAEQALNVARAQQQFSLARQIEQRLELFRAGKPFVQRRPSKEEREKFMPKS